MSFSPSLLVGRTVSPNLSCLACDIYYSLYMCLPTHALLLEDALLGRAFFKCHSQRSDYAWCLNQAACLHASLLLIAIAAPQQSGNIWIWYHLTKSCGESRKSKRLSHQGRPGDRFHEYLISFVSYLIFFQYFFFLYFCKKNYDTKISKLRQVC
jgi:hypothetical protein